MSKKANLWAAATFIVGLAGLQFYLDRLERELRGGPQRSVLVVTRNLEAGDMITDSVLASVAVPERYLDERRIRSAETGRAIGLRVEEPLRTGDFVLWSDLADGSAHRHLAELVKPGQRAYTLEREANAFGSLLHVGDRVDVLVQQRGSSDTLLEKVQVLAVGGNLRTADSEEDGRSHRANTGVTLSVTPMQASQLQLAEARGKLRLVLRNPRDQRLSHQLGPIQETAISQDQRTSIASGESDGPRDVR